MAGARGWPVPAWRRAELLQFAVPEGAGGWQRPETSAERDAEELPGSGEQWAGGRGSSSSPGAEAVPPPGSPAAAHLHNRRRKPCGGV